MAWSTSAATRRTSSAGQAQGAARLGLSRRVAVFQARRSSARRAAIDYRGAAGKLHTRYGTVSNPLHAAWLAAAAEAGYPRSGDVNGFQQEGFGRMDMTVGGGQALQRRECLPAGPPCSRSNLKVLTHALATRIVFDGRRAVALEYRHGGAHAPRAGQRAN